MRSLSLICKFFLTVVKDTNICSDEQLLWNKKPAGALNGYWEWGRKTASGILAVVQVIGPEEHTCFQVVQRMHLFIPLLASSILKSEEVTKNGLGRTLFVLQSYLSRIWFVLLETKKRRF